MSTSWSQNDLDYLISNYGHVSTFSIADKLQRSEDSIRIKANRLKLPMVNIGQWHRKNSTKFWTDEEIEYLKREYPYRTADIIAKQLNKTVLAVRCCAFKLDLEKEIRTRSSVPDSQKKYRVNKLAFSSLTPEVAYVIGFFLADGNVGWNRIKFSNNNFEILSKIKTILSSSHPIRECSQSKGKCFDLTIVDRDLCNNVLALGIPKRKSLIATIPDIPDSLFIHFLRGYFDGNGSSRYSKKGGLAIRITSGSRTLLEELKQHIETIIHIKGSAVKCDKGKQNAWRLYYCGSRALTLGNAMYDGVDDLYIPYKREPFIAYSLNSKQRKSWKYPAP
jgi:intein/homing endonuclease